MTRTSRPALELTQPPIKWAPGVFRAVNRPGHEADHPTSSTERLQMRGATPLLRLYGFVARTGNNSPFTIHESCHTNVTNIGLTSSLVYFVRQFHN